MYFIYQLNKKFRKIFRKINHLHQKEKNKSICPAYPWLLIYELFVCKIHEIIMAASESISAEYISVYPGTVYTRQMLD